MSDIEFGLGPLFDMSGDAFVNAATAVERWGRVPAVVQEREDRLPEHEGDAKWNAIYRLFGARDEGARDEAFVAVNAYFAVNGCSPYGKYSRVVRTAGGVEVPVAHVVKVTGRLEGDIRQFLRSKLENSYNAMKFGRALFDDEAALARAESRGIPRHLVYLLCDWFKDCEYLTAEEEEIYKAISARNIAGARARRELAKSEVGSRADIGADVTSVPEYSNAAPVSY